MFAHSSRRLGLAAVVGLTFLLGQANPPRAFAVPCNEKKAVKIGCPIAQRDCGDRRCSNMFICKSSTCWSVTTVYSDDFRCDPIDGIEQNLYDGKWHCAIQLVFIGTWPIPVTAPCLDIKYCMYVKRRCVPNANDFDVKRHILHVTTHDCTKGS